MLKAVDAREERIKSTKVALKVFLGTDVDSEIWSFGGADDKDQNEEVAANANDSVVRKASAPR